MNRRTLTAAGVFCLLVALGIGSRLLVEIYPDYPPNFHAVIATSLFAGFYFRSRAVAVCVPLISMLASDVLLGGYEGPVMAAVYGGLVVPVFWGTLLRHRLTAIGVGGAAIWSSVFFFVVSNFACWAWGTASHGSVTLARCYALAVPFFKYELAGDLFFSAALFGLYAVAQAAFADSAAVSAADA